MWRAGDLEPGEAHDAEAGEEEVGVAAAVGFEGVASVVRAPAVGFGDEPAGGPDEVDLVSAEADIGFGSRDACGPNKREEAPLGL